MYAGSSGNDITPVSLENLSAELAVVEWGKCLACSCSELSTSAWRAQICASHDKGLLNGMYLLAHLKYMSFFVCDRHILLLASTLYLVEAMSAELQIRIDELWEHRSTTAVLTAFVYLHTEWFVNILRFI